MHIHSIPSDTDGRLAGMPEQDRHLVYESGGWEVDLARRELRARGDSVALGRRAFAIFAVLVESAGKLVTRNELMARVWPHVIVDDINLRVQVSGLRKALGEQCIGTVQGRGYTFVAPLSQNKAARFTALRQEQPWMYQLGR